jgi:FixJ family two-component response regulator
MGSPNEMVYIVDDDSTVCDALSSLLRANGKNVRLFSSGAEFLSFERRDVGACLILDLRMPGMDGLEVQKLVSNQASIPVIFVTGQGNVPSTVRAMKGGAVDFLTKPIDEAVLLAAVEHALEKDRIARCEALEQADLLARYHLLTPREREVLPLLVSGLLKQADCMGAGDHGVHGSNTPREYHA